jgi:CRISPR/Cas system-associated exonuclease Cas4 (RecB family)
MSNEWVRRPGHKEVSATKLKWFAKCPHAFKLKYIEKIDPIYFDPDIFKVGFMVHDTIHEYYMCKPEIDKIREFVTATLYRKWDFSLHYDKFANAVLYIKNFIDFEVLRRKQEDIFPETEIERSKDGYFGIIDFYRGDKNLVMDFKTGKKVKERKSYIFQAVVYNTIVPADNEVFFYYLGPNEIVPIVVTEEMNTEVRCLKDQINDAFKNREFPAIGSCKYCEYKSLCAKVH